MKKIVINKRKNVMLMTCFVFIMTYSSLLGTPGFSYKLSVFVDENNLTHEDIKDLIVKINQIESQNNKKLTQELRKIGKRKEKQKNREFLTSEKNQNIFLEKEKNIQKNSKNIGDIGIFLMKKSENNLRARE